MFNSTTPVLFISFQFYISYILCSHSFWINVQYSNIYSNMTKYGNLPTSVNSPWVSFLQQGEEKNQLSPMHILGIYKLAK